MLALAVAAGGAYALGLVGGGGNTSPEPLLLLANGDDSFDVYFGTVGESPRIGNRVLENITPLGFLFDFSGDQTLEYHGYGMPHDGGTLFGYSHVDQDGSTSTAVLAIVQEGEVIDIVEGIGEELVVARYAGRTIAYIESAFPETCTIYSLNGRTVAETATGNACELYGEVMSIEVDVGEDQYVRQIPPVHISETLLFDSGRRGRYQITTADYSAVVAVQEGPEETRIEFTPADGTPVIRNVTGEFEYDGVLNDGMTMLERLGDYERLIYFPADGGKDILVADRYVGSAIAPSGNHVVAFGRSGSDEAVITLLDESKDRAVELGELRGVSLAGWTTDTQLLAADLHGAVWAISIDGELANVGSIQNDQRIFFENIVEGRAILRTEDAERINGAHYLFSEDHLVEIGSDIERLKSYFSADGTVLVVVVDGGSSGDQLAAVDFESGRTTVLDEARHFSGISLDGNRVVYTAWGNERYGDPEARQYLIGEDIRPSVLQEGTNLLLGTPDSRSPRAYLPNEEAIHW